MSKAISRDEFDSMASAEREEVIRSGALIYDGKEPPRPIRPAKDTYQISRKLYDSLTIGQEQELNRKYSVQIID